MSPRHYSLLALATLCTPALVLAQAPAMPATPLASRRFPQPTDLPSQVDSDGGLRGPQYGYNQCNSTTENQKSLCQTFYFNDLSDFCLWAPADLNTVANTEGEMVAWCTKPGYGTRLIPAGAISGVQFIRTPAYIQVVGFINQPLINLQAGDSGGELDPHGADLRGNPMGGIVYSTAFGAGDGGKYKQIIEWTNFMGGNGFCLKACDPANADAAHFCEHIYDRIGCAYNVPNAAKDNVFEECQGDNMDFPGIYTANGQVMTYTQPAEELGAINAMPYTARVPASSSCTQHSSSALFQALPTESSSSSGASASAKVTGSPTSAAPKATGSATVDGKNGQATRNAGQVIAISGISLLGAIFAAVFLS